MNPIEKLYKRKNATVQKSISIESGLYEKLKSIAKSKYDATISQVVNVCIEELVNSKNIKYYKKPQGEIMIYRSIMLRYENIQELKRIKDETGISITRLINLSIKEFLEKQKEEE